MKKSDHSKFGPKTRQLRFETMEERLVLSAGPCESYGLVQPVGNEYDVQADLNERAEYEKKTLVFLDGLTEEQKLEFKATYCAASADSTDQADVSGIPLETTPTECFENISGPQDSTWRNQQAPTILVKKVQDGLVDRDGKVVQDIIFEFERIIDPSNPDAINQSFTTWYSYKDQHGDKATPYGLTKNSDGSFTTVNTYGYAAVETYHTVTFQPGETKVQWVYKVNHDQYLDDIIIALDTVNLHDHYNTSQPATADTWLRAKVNLAEDWRLPNVNDTASPTFTVSGLTTDELNERTYTITVKTTDFDGHEAETAVGTYTVKARNHETEAPVAYPCNGIEPELDVSEQTPLKERSVASFANHSLSAPESRLAVAENPTNTMRVRQMLDLDQSQKKSDALVLPELIWSDDELFEKDWIELAKQQKKADFWSEVFVDELLPLESGVPLDIQS